MLTDYINLSVTCRSGAVPDPPVVGAAGAAAADSYHQLGVLYPLNS